MQQFDYRIISEGEILLDMNKVDITFMDNSPAFTSYPAISMYPNLFGNAELAQYDGFFSLSADPFASTESQDKLKEFFNVLLDCENNNSIISIQVKPSLSKNEFITILNNVKPEKVSRITRLEKNNQFTFSTYMVYKSK